MVPLFSSKGGFYYAQVFSPNHTRIQFFLKLNHCTPSKSWRPKGNFQFLGITWVYLSGLKTQQLSFRFAFLPPRLWNRGRSSKVDPQSASDCASAIVHYFLSPISPSISFFQLWTQIRTNALSSLLFCSHHKVSPGSSQLTGWRVFMHFFCRRNYVFFKARKDFLLS